jgi:serine-type D-Ala-D-Ala carboxypeptidase/endopeptidase (penicillin-binding protein 4)
MSYRFKGLVIINYLLVIITGCSVQKQISRSVKKNIINDSSFLAAHTGISIYDPSANKYLYNYQGDKYFVPASNTKIPTCYAAMKYLGDSLVGLRYGIPEGDELKKRVFAFKVTADPTFLHTDYKYQPVFNFLKNKILYDRLNAAIFFDTLKVGTTEGLGDGWSWNDYQEPYMAEHNKFPVFGNIISITLKDTSKRVWVNPDYKWEKKYSFFTTGSHFFDSLVNKDLRWIQSAANKYEPLIEVKRDFSANVFYGRPSDKPFKGQQIPFVTRGIQTTIEFLEDTLKGVFEAVTPTSDKDVYYYDCAGCDVAFLKIKNWIPIHSQPTDSLLKPMMHRSDNFFAEQTLLMVSNERLGIMNDEKIIDTILKTDFKDLPQKPRWVDGSGLSRYNLFTPQSLIAILNKMKNEFGMERIKVILPTGGEGTISNYYKADSGYIYAKTGTLSGVVALSGFLYTKKNKLLIFSVLVNNHRANAVDIRKAVERFLEGVRDKY